MKKGIIAALMLVGSTAVFADGLQRCTAAVSPVTAYKGELISDIKIAKDYYINSNDPSAGRTLEERTTNLKKHIDRKIDQFVGHRSREYQAVECTFYAEKTCTNGKHRLKTCGQSLMIPDNYAIQVVTKTQNGDLKSFSQIGNSFEFSAGRSSPGKATAFVRVTARYTEQFTKAQIDGEVRDIKQDLNQLKIPTEF